MIKQVGLKRDTHILTRPSGILYRNIEEPDPELPDDMHFVYFANDFDGSKIPNRAANSTMGDYLMNGTLIQYGSGADCYLSNNEQKYNYLYIDLAYDDYAKMRLDTTNTYTYFVRVDTDNGGVGGILSWRAWGSYNYMIRCENQRLQLHTNTGYTLGPAFELSPVLVFKIEVGSNYMKAVNVYTGDEDTVSNGSTISIGQRMTTFNAGYGSEYFLKYFYAAAGIARATTHDEDMQISDYLMSQGVS